MPSSTHPVLAFLATGRVSNLPTVWSNVLLGVFFLSPLSLSIGETPLFLLLLSTCIITSLLYVGGCLLGDYNDLAFDTIHRPNRPLPRGVLSPKFIVVTAYTFLLLGVFLAFYITPSLFFQKEASLNTPPHILSGWMASILAGSIISYAYLHKKFPRVGLFNMALCRFFLVFYSMIIGFIWIYQSKEYAPFPLGKPLFDLLLTHPAYLVSAISVGYYTYLLSMVAATESSPEQFHHRRVLFAQMVILPLLGFITSYCLAPEHLTHSGYWQAFLFYVIYVAWICHAFTVLKHSKPGFVSKALAGFCLLDASLMAPTSISHSLSCIALFVVALILQKITPAT